MARPPSVADHDFATRLQALGIEATAERVQSFREVGLLEAPDRIYPGGGGSVGRYPPEAVDRMREALALVEKYPHALRTAVAVMFVRGRYQIPLHKLRRALLHVINRYRADIDRAVHGAPAGDDTDALVIAAGEMIAKRIGRDRSSEPLRRNVKRQSGRRREDVVVDLATSWVDTFLTGRVPSPQTLENTALYFGITNIVGQELVEQAAALAGRDDPPNLSHPEIVKALRAATQADLDRARTDVVDFLRCVASLPRIAELMSHEPVPEMPGGMDDDEGLVIGTIVYVTRMKANLGAYERDTLTVQKINACVHLIELTPLELRPAYVATDASSLNLSAEQLRQLATIREQFSLDFPNEAKLLPLWPYNSE
jgi:hypothetical protein